MASTNVDYYQKQKDLLDSMHENEDRRRKLESQLQTYFQSDTKLAKLRAVKLQSYWKKICEDEKRSKQRNSQLLRDLDRIEANMAGLEARREKIKHMKEQYFEYIEHMYPQWLELVQQKRDEQNQFEHNKQQDILEKQQQQAYQQQQQQQAYQQQQQQAYLLQEQQRQLQEHSFQIQHQELRQKQQQEQKAMFEQRQQMQAEESQKRFDNEQTYKKEQEYMLEKQHQKQSMNPDDEEEEDEGEGFGYEVPPPLPSQPPPSMPYGSSSNEFADREYTNLKDIRRQPQVIAPSQIVTVHVPSADREEAGSPAKLRPDSAHRDPSNPNWVPADRDTSVQSLSVSEMDGDLPAFSQPIQSVTVRQKSEPPKTMAALSDEDISEFGDDVDLPSGDGPVPTIVKQEIHSVTTMAAGDGQRQETSAQINDLNDDDDDDDNDDEGPVVVHPELSTPGLLSLLGYVEEEITNALAVEGYYRSRNPDPSKRKDIIHKANSHMDLANTDGESLSMVILEQLTPVVRRLPGACLLSDTLLVRNVNTLNESIIRENLHRDALALWNKLLEHFMCLVRNHVMGTRELATVFVPCLVHMSSQHQDKAVSILETIVENAFNRKEGTASPVQQDSVTLDTARSSQQGGVPPLKFGSLVDSKAYTDEESSIITQSMNTEGPKLPLTETEAYKNLLSGSMPATRPQVQDDDTDENSDNDMEKHFMSTFTPRSHASKPLSPPLNDAHSSAPPPHVDDSPDQSSDHEPSSEIGYIPTGPEQSTLKSALGSTGGSSQQRRLADKLGMNSDLDSDTEVDIGNMVTKKEEDDDDFYDFYG